jgi:aspartyl-tRNA(Asn)/glutamyl-tRNA(Gln) amidotransferase subunit A
VPELAFLSAAELRAGFVERSFSPREALESLIDRIEQFDPALGAFVTLCLARARSEADAATARYLQRQTAGALDGIPVGIKDLIDTAGVRTTYGSRMFAAHVPTRDADAVSRLREAGAIVIGKTQTHEFAWGISSINDAMGTAHNPWDPSRIAGGSSGGSAVALAAGFVPLALGTDTGGSIRIPSAFCGTTGFKPTYGAVSTRGVFPLAPSLDHVGPMARSPADASLLLAVLAPETAREPGRLPGRRYGEGDAPLAGLRIGRCGQLDGATPTAAIADAIASTCSLIEALGGELVVVELPEAEGLCDAYFAIQRAEALASHREAGLYPRRSAEYGPDVGGWLVLAAQAPSGELDGAVAARERLRGGLRRLFTEADLLLSPVAACSPFRIGDETVEHDGVPRTLRELVLGDTVAQDLAGLPACTLRVGFDEYDCPIGLQLTAAAGRDRWLLAAVEELYTASPKLQRRWPALAWA